MGLDMYANVTTNTPDQPFGFADETAERIHYWRKHPNLHGWMENLYFEKGGTEVSNCIALVLTTDDLAGSERWRQRAQPVCGGLGGAGRNLDMHPARAVDAKNLAGDAALADDNRFLFGGAGLRFPDRFTPADDIRHNKLSTAIQPFHAPPIRTRQCKQALSAPLS